MVENSGIGQDDSRDAVLQVTNPEDTRKEKDGTPPAPTPSHLLLPSPVRAVAPAKPRGFPVGAAAKKAAVPPTTPRISKQGKPGAKGGRPPRSPTSIAAATAAQKVRAQHLKRSLGLKRMSTPTGSDGSSNPQCGSQSSQVQSDSVPISRSPQREVSIDSQPIEIDDTEEEEEIMAGSKRKLKSVVWNDFTKVKIGSSKYAKCNYCSKKLSGESRNGINHLRVHLKSCVLKRIKMNGKTMVQSGLRFDMTDVGKISVENYTFDQDLARKELSAMIVLHEYPLSMVDHVGFRRFVGALQPLFKMVLAFKDLLVLFNDLYPVKNDPNNNPMAEPAIKMVLA